MSTLSTGVAHCCNFGAIVQVLQTNYTAYQYA